MRISDWSSDVCSSDLQPWLVAALAAQGRHHCLQSGKADGYVGFADDQSSAGGACACRGELFAGQRYTGGRSEEHTSELQSLMRISYAVFCLKKKTTS